ncbi:MAG TPA: patatin-like phospholipase family protein, partial [Longimicrobiaceae bacterium]|nr:patatin-like phospholipase family protein [Longimicrobiaceae bacterium]
AMSDSNDVTTAPPAPADAPRVPGPLGELALSFSGGGYRAAAFHLGALRMFSRVGLLRDVVALSTVSGGSIVGAAWVLSVLRGERFADFDAGFAAYLKQNNVISEALEHLTSHREHGHPSYPALIRSAARIYARPNLFGDTRLGAITVPNTPTGDDQPRFREVIFNSTEFRTGVDFRFRRSANALARVGNGNLRVPGEVAERVRVADAVAASSCFPGGFEPFLFPQQFSWPDDLPLKQVEEKLGEPFKGGVPLMDGGIWDNQGVDSLLLAFRRGGAATLFISDVAARANDIYTYPSPQKRGWLTLRMGSILAWVLLAASVASTLLVGKAGWDAWHAGPRGLRFFLEYGLPLGFCLAVVAVLVWTRFVMADVQKRLRETVQVDDVWKDVARLTVREALLLVELRVGSLLALTSTVFMKRIRGLIFHDVTNDPTYQGKWMANFIYALALRSPKLWEKYPWLEPSSTLRKLAADAEAFPTTLWFDNPEQCDMVAKAGEVTACYILLKYILEYHAEKLQQPDSPVARLYAKLRQEWDVFNGAAAARAGAIASSAPAAAPAV